MLRKLIVNVLIPILTVALVTGCSANEPREAVDTPAQTPEARVRDAAAKAFESYVDTVTVHVPSDENANWDVKVELASTPDTSVLDACAAALLGDIASHDSSATMPIYVTISSAGLKPENSRSGWGRLSYQWNDNHVGAIAPQRGSTVTMYHGETSVPGPAQCGCAYIANPRGEWTDVDAETLLKWARDGAPEPLPFTQ